MQPWGTTMRPPQPQFSPGMWQTAGGPSQGPQGSPEYQAMRNATARARVAGERSNIDARGPIPDVRDPLPRNAGFIERLHHGMQSPMAQEFIYVLLVALFQAGLYMVFRRRPPTLEPFI